MPPGGAEARAGQMAALRVTTHEMLTDPRVGDLLDAAEAEAGGLDAWRHANLREMRHRWRHASALDGDLVDALTRAASACQMAWREARPAADFARIREPFERLARAAARMRRGARRSDRPHALRGADGSVRAGGPDGTHRHAVRRPRGDLARHSRGRARPPGRAARAGRAAGPVPGRRAAGACRAIHARARLRLPSRPARRDAAPVLLAACPRTCASPRAGTRTGSSTG